MHLKNALYIPTFQQNIFLIQATTKKKNGAHLSFEWDNSQLIYHNEAVFNIAQRGQLYYLKNIISASYNLYTWHKILGYCNESDIKKLPYLVKGMKIKLTRNYTFNFDICIKGKMSNDRNKTLGQKATKFSHSCTVI